MLARVSVRFVRLKRSSVRHRIGQQEFARSNRELALTHDGLRMVLRVIPVGKRSRYFIWRSFLIQVTGLPNGSVQ